MCWVQNSNARMSNYYSYLFSLLRVLLKLMHMQFDSHNHATISIFVLYYICAFVYHLIDSLNPIAVFFYLFVCFYKKSFQPYCTC